MTEFCKGTHNDQLFCNGDLVVASTEGMKSASGLKYSPKILGSPFRSTQAKLFSNIVTQVSLARAELLVMGMYDALGQVELNCQSSVCELVQLDSR